jgi:hypothetical protein
MNKYAKASILAINHHNQSDVKDITKSWQIAMMEVFPTKESSRKKGCPKSTFLGLCENGYVKGIPRGKYLLRSDSKYKNYAIKAIKLLKNNPQLSNLKPSNLWELVMNGVIKTPNSQMDIVLALWKQNYIQ